MTMGTLFIIASYIESSLGGIQWVEKTFSKVTWHMTVSTFHSRKDLGLHREGKYQRCSDATVFKGTLGVMDYVLMKMVVRLQAVALHTPDQFNFL